MIFELFIPEQLLGHFFLPSHFLSSHNLPHWEPFTPRCSIAANFFRQVLMLQHSAATSAPNWTFKKMVCQRSTWAQNFDNLAQISTYFQISLAGGPCSTRKQSKVKNYGWAPNSNLVLERQQGAVFGTYGLIHDMFNRDHSSQTHGCEQKLIPLKHLCFQKCSAFSMPRYFAAHLQLHEL